MGDILDEASSFLECRECPWYKSCIMPMRFGADDLMREMGQMTPGTGSGQPGVSGAERAPGRLPHLCQKIEVKSQAGGADQEAHAKLGKRGTLASVSTCIYPAPSLFHIKSQSPRQSHPLAFR